MCARKNFDDNFTCTYILQMYVCTFVLQHPQQVWGQIIQAVPIQCVCAFLLFVISETALMYVEQLIEQLVEEAQKMKDTDSEGSNHRSASPGEASNIGNGQSSPNSKDKEGTILYILMYLQ